MSWQSQFKNLNNEAKKRIYNNIMNEIPRKYQKITTDKKILRDKYFDEKKGLYITGNPGTGKTVFLCSLAKKYIINDISIKYLSYTQFIMQLQCMYRESSSNPLDFINEIVWEPILFIDDLGAEKPTDFVRQTTYYLLNEREQRCLTTIISSNLSLSQLDAQMDARISSRISGMCEILNFTGKDRRADT